MTDKKLTDNEIKKFVKSMRKNAVKNEQGIIVCSPELWELIASILENASDLINHQKAENSELQLKIASCNSEIERLRQTYPHNRYPVCVKVRNGEIYTHTLNDYDWLIGDISAEAIKEFAERLKKHLDTYTDDEESNALYMINLINDLAKEMVDNNDL